LGFFFFVFFFFWVGRCFLRWPTVRVFLLLPPSAEPFMNSSLLLSEPFGRVTFKRWLRCLINVPPRVRVQSCTRPCLPFNLEPPHMISCSTQSHRTEAFGTFFFPPHSALSSSAAWFTPAGANWSRRPSSVLTAWKTLQPRLPILCARPHLCGSLLFFV